MALLSLLFVLVQSLMQYPQPDGDGLDEATHRQMQEREELLDCEMARLLQELEQGPPEQQDEGWGALLFGALQQWPFWALAGLLLLLGLWFSCRRSPEASKTNSSGKDQTSCKTLGEEKEKEKEEDSLGSERDGENIDVTVEADDSGSGNEGEGSPVAANEGDDNDANERDEDVKLKKDSDVKSDDGHDARKDEGWSDGNMPGDNTAEGNEEEPGNVTGGVEDLDEANEGENKDVKVEPDKDAGKEEEGDGNEEKTDDAYMKAGNNDVREGEDGKEEKADVKVQESSDASEQRSSDWTGQEDSRDGGNAVDHCGFAATEEEKKDIGNEESNLGDKDEKASAADMKGEKNENGNEEEHGNVASTEEGVDKINEGESSNMKVKEDSHSSEHRADWNGKDQENRDANVKGEKNEDGKEEEGGNVAASEKEGGAGKDKGSSGGIEEEEDACDFGNKRGILLVDRIQCPVEDVERGRSVAAELMESFTRVFIDSVSNSFYPVPQEAIGVGSAFEGWSPREQDVVYRVLVPLNPPPGHAFHLELNSAGQMAARTFCVRVELVCTCEGKQKPILLETLCTGSYLDVEKPSHWFYQLVRCSWLHLPQSYSWHLVFQPCSRSCQFRLSKGKKSLMVEMLFGVRHGDSDIFVVSQPTEAQKGGSSIFVSSQPAEADSIASTAWPETYAVAEAKFFQHIARQVPCESLHLKCLQLFTCILRGTGFSSSTWKTVVMHVLTTVPLSQWRRREFARRLWDIMAYLRRCLQLKHLEHFVLGNQRLPAEISLPPAMRTVEPLNLFEHLARDPAAHAEAMRAYGQLRFRLWMLLSNH
ncbi:PREDICTED: LOW QUALITY PROTEIN: uncharacterized protein LOC103617094 [Corvus brachyrhynchos]|uniref:LOW QUALITY PROTEIN: uncharacterized protein LOC103617094 n=1 Tax=Corvus brachyrhynchos TaxID=85066 RepID=UPI000816759A|nr:PREDICTED: LOW QUALITY PROTEIN: uncharacterized protein LOC103617094 [Corvus brachyrhynchos]